MILSVSNIAWLPEERLGAYDLMEEAGLSGLEIAPAIFFAGAADPFVPDDAIADAALAEIRARGFSLVSMQALLFGVQGAALFGDAAARAAFERGMTRAIDLAGRFGIPNIVFGSPGQRRIPDDMAPGDALDQAAETFRRLGDRAAASGTVIAVESNPPAYGTNFLNTLEDAEAFVELVSHPAVAVILDLGAMHMNGSFGTVAERAAALAPRLSHVHVSEPNLAPAPDDATDLAPVLAGLRAGGYGRAVSIEMKRHEGGLATVRDRIAALVRAAEGEGR
ncbi:sugar phosphate isomerase/epimerase [Kaistia geumhonensis]|uniref:Sugar phosphate isomerase/epimerase n=1 Tax=Kaistia geumhonensis TaxID=410839 RepID=A0ABU0M435_9HYPH|nr:sugar phosphate isomerase/epimerase family protein [Kaistia geumhonensis]MCX5479077.1 sugar phosphate isomerase/epimerase [Kaistia geumhonensis]MDQ0515703.1 sugar phosphate isomerase/epimerase [Kaistia geumhonensis]